MSIQTEVNELKVLITAVADLLSTNTISSEQGAEMLCKLIEKL